VFGDLPFIELPGSTVDSAESAMRHLVDHLASSGEVAPECAADTIHTLLRREQLGSTVVGAGLALPHAITRAVRQVVGLVGSSRAGIDWEGGRARVLPVQQATDGSQRVHAASLNSTASRWRVGCCGPQQPLPPCGFHRPSVLLLGHWTCAFSLRRAC
jgi:mannitol/fructose-specific phosphotransferase system IIA component